MSKRWRLRREWEPVAPVKRVSLPKVGAGVEYGGWQVCSCCGEGFDWEVPEGVGDLLWMGMRARDVGYKVRCPGCFTFQYPMCPADALE